MAARVAHADADRRLARERNSARLHFRAIGWQLDALRAMGNDLDRAVELPAYAARVVAKLTDENRNVRVAALQTLGGLEPAVLEPHADAVVAKLGHEDRGVGVRWAALETLGKGLDKKLT